MSPINPTIQHPQNNPSVLVSELDDQKGNPIKRLSFDPNIKRDTTKALKGIPSVRTQQDENVTLVSIFIENICALTPKITENFIGLAAL